MHAAILHSDVCLLIGHDVVEKPPFFMSANSKKIVGAMHSGASCCLSPCLGPAYQWCQSSPGCRQCRLAAVQRKVAGYRWRLS